VNIFKTILAVVVAQKWSFIEKSALLFCWDSIH